ncbi:MAG: hypothetical protein IJX89_05130 [Alphaproteobacteria bacterium]|nr:hypothetical protein [Alphaproteobacteria bacterium]
MQNKYKETDIYNAIKSGFANLRILARADIKRRWKTLSREEKYAAARSLVYIGGVANNPAKFFAPENTARDWYVRAETFAREKSLDGKDVASAFYIVQDPKGIVYNAAGNAIWGELNIELFNFCAAVQGWEYDRISNREFIRDGADRFAANILDMSKRFASLVSIQRANPILRPFKEMAFALQK